MTIKIATIITVFNRKQKTLSSLKHLFAAEMFYNKKYQEERIINVSVFLTDDGSTDGTADAVRAEFPEHDITILQGTGNLFWAGGMRMAWKAAINTRTAWDYYLLLNDDTYMNENCFIELFQTHDYSMKTFGKHGLYSGITCSPDNPSVTTYGGNRFTGWAKGKKAILTPTGVPQTADMTHANILLVHKSIVTSQGIFYEGFHHGSADFDYSMQARSQGFPLLVTAHVCGTCERDHDSSKENIERLMNMTHSERSEYVRQPAHLDNDYLLFVRRNLPLRYPMAIIIRKIRVFFPKLYYYISKTRGLYK